MSKKPVRGLADLRGFDLRASGGAAQILKAWGANQVGMPMSATPEALQKGVVKGLFSSLEVMKDFKFAEICKYVTITDTVIYPFAVVMNMDRWNALPDDQRKGKKGVQSHTGSHHQRGVGLNGRFHGCVDIIRARRVHCGQSEVVRLRILEHFLHVVAGDYAGRHHLF